MSHDLKELRNLLEFAKDIRGGPPDIVWDAFDQPLSNENRLSHSRAVIYHISRLPIFKMSMIEAYALGATIAFLNLEIERLEALSEREAKP